MIAHRRNRPRPAASTSPFGAAATASLASAPSTTASSSTFRRCASVRVDPANADGARGRRRTWGDFNDATHAFGLATTGGIISTTGVAGLTLGGGIGYLARELRLVVRQPDRPPMW